MMTPPRVAKVERSAKVDTVKKLVGAGVLVGTGVGKDVGADVGECDDDGADDSGDISTGSAQIFSDFVPPAAAPVVATTPFPI